MMMLIFSVIVMCSYLYSVCLVFRVLRNTYLKEQLSAVASKYNIWDMKNNMEKAWFMAPMEKAYGPNGIYLIVYSPNGKGMVL